MDKNLNEKMSSKKLITSRYDAIFKAVMIELKDVLEKVLESVLDKKVEIIDFVNQDIPVKIKKKESRQWI